MPKPPLPPFISVTRSPTRGEIGEQRLAVLLVDLRADRNLEHHVLAVGAVHVLAHAVAAGLGLEVLLVAVVDQRVEAIDRLDHDVAALAAVAAGGAAELDELLAPERDAAVAAGAGLHIDLGFVEEFQSQSALTLCACARSPRVRAQDGCIADRARLSRRHPRERNSSNPSERRILMPSVFGIEFETDRHHAGQIVLRQIAVATNCFRRLHRFSELEVFSTSAFCFS